MSRIIQRFAVNKHPIKLSIKHIVIKMGLLRPLINVNTHLEEVFGTYENYETYFLPLMREFESFGQPAVSLIKDFGTGNYLQVSS